ncbi:MAG: 2-oxoglutarate dehydrogenase complex dihydrolipoyllysine-residue succinyltransferase [Desulfosarcinaceae bacterium]|nr:2-oxoglutarate dehydrogenase complex dihydrolipoyllysine-residue succinyltransferase [Desulfosarcinaceae bacterium]
MAIEITIPSVGESITEALLAEWFKADGETVQKEDPLLVIETDKVTLEVVAEASGVLKITVPAGETVSIGAVVGEIDTAGAAAAPPKAEAPEPAAAADEIPPAPTEAAPTPPPETPAPPTQPAPTPAAPTPPAKAVPPMSPSVRRLVAEKRIDIDAIRGSGPGGRITKGDILLHLEQAPVGIPEPVCPPVEMGAADAAAAQEVRQPMSPIRKRIASRLLAAKQNTAMLTTFNEIDMQRTIEIRGAYKEAFEKRHGVRLGFMSFFVKACVEALKEVPEINAFIDGDDIIYHNYQHVGVAVGTERGLVVPVIRHAERLSFAEIEQTIVDYVKKITANRLELADLEGGTFTVSNGGVYGSLLSTPILNMPQSGILGMHKTEKRPVVVDDEIVIRPMMYVALSYDHRIVDGKGAVTFLKRVKEFIENPERILLEV